MWLLQVKQCWLESHFKVWRLFFVVSVSSFSFSFSKRSWSTRRCKPIRLVRRTRCCDITFHSRSPHSLRSLSQSFISVFALALLVLGIPGAPVGADGRGSVARRIPQIHPVDEAWRFLPRRSCRSLIRGRGGARFYVWSSAVGRPKAACGKLK